MKDDIKKKIRKLNYGSLRVEDNLGRIYVAFITAKYYSGLVSAAVSDYMEIGWLTGHVLSLLPSVGMMCGVYLVSNIGRPPRLTVRAVFLSGVVAEVLSEILFGGSIQFVACLICTILSVYWWQWPKSESAKWSGKGACFIVTSCACIAMTLLWGSIIMNTTITVDDNDVLVSEALHNLYNSPAWSQIKEALGDVSIMYLQGDWEEASETLLRISDLRNSSISVRFTKGRR